MGEKIKIQGAMEFTIFKLPMVSIKKFHSAENIFLGDYVPVYKGETIIEEETPIDIILETIFRNVNEGEYKHYYSDDMCSGDMIMIKTATDRNFWLCNIIGWEEVALYI